NRQRRTVVLNRAHFYDQSSPPTSVTQKKRYRDKITRGELNLNKTITAVLLLVSAPFPFWLLFVCGLFLDPFLYNKTPLVV
ncbi:hypothetical protein ACQWHR_24960, partial [Salmonella enterica subsp. enterica serovar Infantis]